MQVYFLKTNNVVQQAAANKVITKQFSITNQDKRTAYH